MSDYKCMIKFKKNVIASNLPSTHFWTLYKVQEIQFFIITVTMKPLWHRC